MAQGTVLVVDDDKKTVATVQLYLENAGFSVSAAYNRRLRTARTTFWLKSASAWNLILMKKPKQNHEDNVVFRCFS